MRKFGQFFGLYHKFRINLLVYCLHGVLKTDILTILIGLLTDIKLTMNIIFVGKFRGKPLRCQLDGSRQLFTCAAIISLFAGLLVSSGYWYGKINTTANELAALEYDISMQKTLINEARQSAESELDALAARLGKMQEIGRASGRERVFRAV